MKHWFLLFLSHSFSVLWILNMPHVYGRAQFNGSGCNTSKWVVKPTSIFNIHSFFSCILQITVYRVKKRERAKNIHIFFRELTPIDCMWSMRQECTRVFNNDKSWGNEKRTKLCISHLYPHLLNHFYQSEYQSHIIHTSNKYSDWFMVKSCSTSISFR